MKTIVLCGFKGGTARTSTTLHLGSALAMFHGKRVLLIDFDAQANLTTGLGFPFDSDKTLVSVLQDKASIHDVITTTCIDNLDLIRSNVMLDGIEATGSLSRDPYNHERLGSLLQGLDYDYCFIDIPPSFGWLTRSAFYASSYSLICAVPEPYSMLALGRLKTYHEDVCKRHDIRILGVLLSFWDNRTATNDSFIEGIEAIFPGKVFNSRIRKDISVNRAILEGMPVFKTHSQSRVAEDYKQLAKEFLDKIEVEVSV